MQRMTLWARALAPAVCCVGCLSLMSASSAFGQTLSSSDTGYRRLSVNIGYGGHGVDWETSVDSPRIGDGIRFRVALGQGDWVGMPDGPAGPAVIRFGASALLYLTPQSVQPGLTAPLDIRPYLGLGICRYDPLGSDRPAQHGSQLVLGIEGSGWSWTFGPEIQVDVPNARDSQHRAPNELPPTMRISLSVRHRF